MWYTIFLSTTDSEAFEEEKKKQASRSSRPPTEKPPNTAESLTAKIISLTDMTPSTYESEIQKRQMRRCDRNIVKVF